MLEKSNLIKFYTLRDFKVLFSLPDHIQTANYDWTANHDQEMEGSWMVSIPGLFEI